MFFFKLLKTVLQQSPPPPPSNFMEMIHLCSRTTQGVQVTFPPTSCGPATHVARINKHCWHLPFPPGTQRTEDVKGRECPLGCGMLSLPWPQPLQALAEVVVEEEIQGLHTFIQALFQGHRRGSDTHKRHRSEISHPLKTFFF